MMTLYPSIALVSYNLSVYSAFFIKIMVQSMEKKPWTQQDKTSNALLCMLGLGSGEILGSLLFGSIMDRLSYKQTIFINIITLSISFAIMIVYSVKLDFSYTLACIMSLSWGVQDAGINCLITSLLGF